MSGNEFTIHSDRDRLGIVTLILALLSLIPLLGLIFGAVAGILIGIRLVKRRDRGWTLASALLLLVAGLIQYWILDGGLNLHLIPG